MNHATRVLGIGVAAFALLLAGAAGVTKTEITSDDLVSFAPLPKTMTAGHHETTAKVDLGRMLYYDVRLSGGHDLSCNSCHDLARFGVDPRGGPVSLGHRGKKGDRNAPTVYNAAGQVAQFWDGRAKDVEAQAVGPITNPVEMAMPDPKRVVATLRSIPGYVKAFAKAYPGIKQPITFENVGDAIGAFERGLVTPSRFDAFLGGKKDALTEPEKRGLKTFVDLGCDACHSGAYLGGAGFEKLGAARPYPNQKDLGRYAVTHDPADKMLFKVPTLRNVTRTGPYFHDGHYTDLPTVVRAMAKYQLDVEALTDAQVKDIVSFLGSLEGEIPKAYVAEPKLPPNGPHTPGPVAD